MAFIAENNAKLLQYASGTWLLASGYWLLAIRNPKSPIRNHFLFAAQVCAFDFRVFHNLGSTAVGNFLPIIEDDHAVCNSKEFF